MDVLASIFTRAPFADRDAARAQVRDAVLTRSRHIQAPNFVRCSGHDLRVLFEGYDDLFFDRGLRGALPHPIELTFNGRLRSAGGRTVRRRDRARGTLDYAIEVSSTLLFNNFRTPEETAFVVGLPCADRLDALMRVMEHELLHVAEFLAFGSSKCAQKRFQTCAANLFGHAEHQHAMITPRQKTLQTTHLRPGDRVRFVFDGLPRRGIINRLNRRATVLVPDTRGERYTDGKHYLKFYIPVGALEPDAA